MKNQALNPRGFTLVELVVTIAVAAILLTMAIPSFITLIRDNQTVSETSKLTRDLTFTRSEAVRRGTPVSMCISNNNGAGCAGANWENGWIIFTDTNNNGVFNGGAETILQVNDGLDTNFALTTVGAINSITYAASGIATPSDTFKICRPDQNAALSRAVNVSPTGRVNVSTAAAANLVCP